MPSDIFHHLTDKLMGQTFADIDNLKEDYEMAKVAALHHSKTENAIAVLSNIHDDSSFIVYGRLGKHLGLSSEMDNNEVPSIWVSFSKLAFVSTVTFLLCIAVGYCALKLWDEPVRKWLRS